MKATIKVAVVIKNKDNKLLLIKEKYNQEGNYKWNFIKGTFDNIDETLAQCAEREVMEESNIKVKNIRLFKVFQYGDEKNMRMLFVFLAEENGDIKKISNKNQQIDESIIEHKWFSIDELQMKTKDEFIAIYVSKVILDYSENFGNVNIEKI